LAPLRVKAKAVLVPVVNEINIGIVGALALGARADLEIDRVALRLIDEMMAVGDPSLETRSVARLQHGRAAVLDQHDLAFEHVNELVFGLVPVAQRGGGTGLESREIDPKLAEPDDIAKGGLLSALGNGAPRFGIDAFGAHHRLGNVYLRHRALLYASIADRLTRLTEVATAGSVALHHEIDIGIVHALARSACADLKIDCVAFAAIDEAMRDTTAGLEARSIARP